MRFGVLGDAKIAREMLLPAIRAAGHEVTHLGRRQANADADPVWGDVIVTDYDTLLADPDVEAVYIPLPNHLHTPYAIKALQAGKPVLCEKPVALSLREIDALEAACTATGLYLYDGYMVRYHPQWKWLQSLDIGRRESIQAHFSYPPRPEGNVRNYANMGGGPIWDIGCYPLLAGLMLFEGTPRLLSVSKLAETHLDVEKSATALIEFGEGQMLSMTVSSAMSLSQSLHIVGTEGWAKLDVPFNPPEVATGRWATTADGPSLLLGLGKEEVFAGCDQYQLMVEDFVMAVQENRQADLRQSRMVTQILSEMVAR